MCTCPTSIWLIVHMVTHLISHSNPRVKKLKTPLITQLVCTGMTATRPTGSQNPHLLSLFLGSLLLLCHVQFSFSLKKWVKKVVLCVWVAQSYLTLQPWTVAWEAPMSLEFSGRGSSHSLLRIFQPGWTQVSTLQARFYHLNPTREARNLLRRFCGTFFPLWPCSSICKKGQLPTGRAYAPCRGRLEDELIQEDIPRGQLFPILPRIWATQQDVLELNGRTAPCSSVQLVAQSYSTLWHYGLQHL